MALLGDPTTRPDEDVCFVPSSYAINASLREWEDTVAVTWAMRAPSSTGPKEVEAVLREEFQLRPGKVTVTGHHPEAFLINFQHPHHCDVAVKQGYAKRRGIDVRFIRWRSLSSALGVTLLYRVKLCLDGIPDHAWDPDIVERIISRRCALETIETNLINPDETKTVDLWAWTANPSSIPKKIWLSFTSQARDAKLSSVLVMETPPEHWQSGSKYGVIVHLEEIHDYTVKSRDEQGNITPGIRRLPRWNLGVIDGQPRPSRAFEDFPHHPPPPRQQRDERRDERDRRRYQEKEERGVWGRYNNDHPDFERGRRWRRHDGEDSDDEGHGRRDFGGRVGRGKLHGHDSVYRERERSPGRRNWDGASHHGRQRTDSIDIVHPILQVNPPIAPPLKQPVQARSENPEVNPSVDPPLQQPVQAQSEKQDSYIECKLQVRTLQKEFRRLLQLADGQVNATQLLSSFLQDCMGKALALAHTLGMGTASGPGGNEALSAPAPPREVAQLIPVNGAFNRILDMLPQPLAAAERAPNATGDASIDVVEKALQQMELLADPPEDQSQAPASPVLIGAEETRGISALFCNPVQPVLQAPTPAPTKATTPPVPPAGVSNVPSTCHRYVEVHA
ncbi:hypothetical protein U9M48_026416 [Paspalum notatum var. saurae]|uniref:Uncharacterized protein n=1 Tax=Paspalum notatum var. saurae TaxID=547442 RepID=A0AAQ3WYT7_PASNO